MKAPSHKPVSNEWSRAILKVTHTWNSYSCDNYGGDKIGMCVYILSSEYQVRIFHISHRLFHLGTSSVCKYLCSWSTYFQIISVNLLTFIINPWLKNNALWRIFVIFLKSFCLVTGQWTISPTQTMTMTMLEGGNKLWKACVDIVTSFIAFRGQSCCTHPHGLSSSSVLSTQWLVVEKECKDYRVLKEIKETGENKYNEGEMLFIPWIK